MSGTAAVTDTTAAALQKALAPKTGMQRIPFPLESYRHVSQPLSQKYLLNLMAEQEPADALTAAALVSTPGLVDSGWGFGGGPVLAMNYDMPGSLYAVSGTHFYRLTHPVSGATVIEDLGDVGTATGDNVWPYDLMPTIAVGPVGAVVCVPPNAWVCDHSGGINQIGGDFPGARSVAYIDGYYVYTSTEVGARFFCNLLQDPTAFDALDFAYADAMPNLLHRVVAMNGDLWFLGDAGIEVWYNAGSSGLETTPGTSFFPFRRRAGGVISSGVAAIRSVAWGDNSLFWLGEGGIVFRSQGYRPVRISTHALEQQFRFRGLQNVLSALTYIQDGKTFYVQSYTTATFVYDCATGLWHNRASSLDGSGPWRPAAVAQFSGSHLFGDSLSGRLFFLEPDIGTDDGVEVLRQFTLPPLFATTRRAFCSRLEVEMETGGVASPREIFVVWSDDGGRNITSGVRTLKTGELTETRKRAFTTRLGSFRGRTFTVTTRHTDRVAFYAVDADITPGAT
jgi:hypothetical protein